MRSRLTMVMISAALTLATPAAAQVVFYQLEEFGGGSVRVDAIIPDLTPLGFNDRASSVFVERDLRSISILRSSPAEIATLPLVSPRIASGAIER